MLCSWGGLATLAVLTATSLTGCGADVRQFPLKSPVWVDDDLRPVSVPCRPHPDPDPDDPPEVCYPETYESPFAWDVADKTVFRPLTQVFAADVGFRAHNVNSHDEVPSSSWFVNRIGRRHMPVEEVLRGSCGVPIDPNAPAGSWLIDQGKPNGANPGFRIRIDGVGKFMLKADPAAEPERGTGATTIATRLYYAAGWWAPCDTVVYFDPSILKLKPGLEFTDNSGVTRPFDEAALEKVLAGASHRGPLVRMVASEWLPGRTIGPFKYEDTRDDDPNDVIPHEDRRDLRGARVIAAWLNHFDSREQNSMDVWLSEDPKRPDSSPGHVRHYYIDLGDCFGSEWEWDEISRRLGHSYYLDLADVTVDFFTLGIPERPWDRAKRSSEGDIFGYFDHERFEPDEWKGGYPNPTFARMDEGDGAWAARIIAEMEPEVVQAAVELGQFTEPRHTSWLTHQLLIRRQRILERYFSELSPLTKPEVSGSEVCAVDLARREIEGTPAASYRYQASLYAGAELGFHSAPKVRSGPDGQVCTSLSHVAADGGAPDGDPSRYAVLDLKNGVAEGPLRVHLYDLGPRRGFALAGIERPDDASAP